MLKLNFDNIIFNSNEARRVGGAVFLYACPLWSSAFGSVTKFSTNKATRGSALLVYSLKINIYTGLLFVFQFYLL